jgi:YD repeat-containing protein
VVQRLPWVRVWCALLVLLGLTGIARGARAQVTQCIDCGVPYSVEVTPDGATVSKATNGTYTASFTVRNNGDLSNTYGFECSTLGPVTCGVVSPSSVTLGTFTQATISVTYSTTATVGSGRVTLEASGTSAQDVGYYTVTTVAPPIVTLVVPTINDGTRALVRTRQPLILAVITSGGSPVDSTPTLSWRGSFVTTDTRRGRGLIEWQVDSARALTAGGAGAGDSALISVKACAKLVACTTVTRWAVLLNDQKPVLGFTGMPLEGLASQFAASFGPGLGVSGADVETGFSTVPYVSMGAARSVSLSYSTRQAYPRALVPVDLELPWPAGTPDQVKLVLLDGATRLDSLVLATPTCATGAAKRCRAVLQGDFSASAFSTPTRKWLTVEASVTSGASTQMGSDSVEVVLVDRRTTRYGSGWWPAAFLQLVAAGSDRVLVGPTGTATIYRGNGDSLYLSPPGDFSRLVKVGTGWELHPRGTTAKLVFDATGRLQASVDANGNRDSLAYSGTTDQLTTWVDPVGQVTTLTYVSGKLQTITDPVSRQTRLVINGTTNQLTYDSLSTPTGKPATTTYVYQTYPGTQTAVLRKRVGVLLDTTIVTYDSTFRRRPTQVRLPRVEDETGAVVTPIIRYTAYERQGYGALRSLDSVYVELKDPRNNWTRSLLNRWAQARQTWDLLGVLSRAQYDPDGLLQWSEGKTADSSRVYQGYDSQDRLVRTYLLRTATDTFRLDSLVYDTKDRVVTRVDPRGKASSVTYDAYGNVLTATDPAGNVSRSWYASTGLVDSTRAPGNTVSQRFTYDPLWRQLATVTDETGDLIASTTYNAHGRPYQTQRKLRVQASAGATQTMQWRRTTTTYRVEDDAVSNVTLERTDNCPDPCTTPTWVSDTLHKETVQYTYDRAGRDSVRLNDRLIKTVYIYDRLGRLVRRQPWADSTGVKDSMAYDIAGNLAKSITRRGDVITTAFDSRNRDTSTVIPGVGTRKKVYGGSLDQLTRLYEVTPTDSIGDVNTELHWRYDQRGRLKADTSYTGATVRASTYTYDSYERPSTLTDATGTWTTRYDATRNLPVTLVTPFADSLLYTYDAQDRPLGPTILSNGPSIQRGLSWLQNGMMDTLRTKVNTATSYKAGEYTRVLDMPDDPVPLNPTWVEQPGSGTSAVTRIDSTTYDGWERVTRWVQTKNNVVLATETMAYDRVGNVLTADG